MPVPPPTAYPAGMQLVVGSHEVVIDKFIGEGGFAHVYTVRASPPIPGHDIACLKRVQVPNKAYLNLLRAEVDAMQRLKGSSNIVEYFDSHAERMHGPQAQGQYEVFLLMEYCDRGGLIDFMNTRLRDQLREHEILKIMYDIALGLAHMHYLSPPLLHRDLKIENVLVSSDGTFKLCDFGSVSPVLRAPKTPQEFQILEDDIQHHTTVQYRAPEMVDIARGHPIDEKSDIWALGIFLYKLCFYTTPFERPNQTLEQFQQLILAGVFTIPPRPAYSERLRNMIRVLLQPDPRLRPNVFQVMQEICAMRHVECPIQDIYSRPTPVNMNVGRMGPAPFPNQVAPPVSDFAPTPVIAPQVHGLGAPALPPRPAPGQVPVPGVLLTSPLATPTSPLSRSVSPLDDEEHINARFPSLEELDRANTASLVDFNASHPHSQTTPTPPPHSTQRAPHHGAQHAQHAQHTAPHAAHPGTQSGAQATKQAAQNAAQLASPLAAPHPAAPAPANAAQASLASSAPAAVPAEDDYPMPQRPARPRPRPARPQSFIEDSKPVSAEAAKLKQILTGISGKSSTVIMDQPPENKNLSSMDFLRTLQTGDGHHHLHKPHKPHLHKARKTFPSYDDDEDDDDDDDDAFSGLPRHDSARQDALRRDHSSSPHFAPDEYSLSDSDAASPLESPKHAVPVKSPKVEEDKPKPQLNIHAKPKPAKPPIAKPVSPKPALPLPSASVPSTPKPVVAASAQPLAAKPALRVSTAPVLRSTKPRPKSMVVGSRELLGRDYLENELTAQSTGEINSFRPTNSIQQRVHSFLSSHDRQHPPRRTARGYGQFTPDGTEDDHLIRETRSRSLGDAVPRPPSRALKPKVNIK